MITGIGSIILFSGDPQTCVAFYQRLGLPLVAEDHGEGPVHYAADIAGCHFAVFPSKPGQAPPHKSGGSHFVGLTVDNLEPTVERAQTFGAPLVEPIRTFPWGRRALVRDPDGRVVELFEPPGPR